MIVTVVPSPKYNSVLLTRRQLSVSDLCRAVSQILRKIRDAAIPPLEAVVYLRLLNNIWSRHKDSCDVWEANAKIVPLILKYCSRKFKSELKLYTEDKKKPHSIISDLLNFLYKEVVYTSRLITHL